MDYTTAILMCITFAVMAVCIVYGTVRVIQNKWPVSSYIAFIAVELVIAIAYAIVMLGIIK